MVTITLEMLKAAGACSDVLGRLQAKYGDSFTATKWEDLIEPIRFSENVNWIIKKFFSNKNKDAYEAATKPHWDAYKAATKPHWDAYEASTKPHLDAYYNATKPHLDAYKAFIKSYVEEYDAAEIAVVAKLLYKELSK